ncbi:MAG: redox-sensing transcriptional repressor Rex [Candidatus Omnitrophica bacterium]|nr:redox-sensing transcriptional repressor Rex [Candidatus Omnitrophota bacterium]
MKVKTKSKASFSLETIKRLSLYLRNLKRAKERNVDVISSDKISQFLNVTPVQFRKDLSYFGGFGKRGVGYNVEKLILEIENILGVNKEWKIIMVGVGRLGSALLSFEGFSKFNIKISFCFDVDEEKTGKTKKGVEILHIKDMKNIIKNNDIKIAIISTPPEAAQDVADELVDAGIKGILNFAPSILKVPEYVSVSNVDMACELESLIFFAKRKRTLKR